MMQKPKILISRKWPTDVEEKLQTLYDVTLNSEDKPLSEDDFKAAMQQYDAVCPAVCDSLPASVINVANRRCKIIANYGVGFNHIDIEACRRQNLPVTNTPGVLTESTADLAMTLMLMTARRAAEGERLVRSGQWTGWCPTQMPGTDITGKTLGLIGFGRIAQAMAKKAHHGFSMKILFYKPSPAEPKAVAELNATACDNIEDLLQQSDVVSLHCPGGASTRHLINAERLKQMKPTAMLINTARGDIVDSRALINALQQGRLAGAGLDVYENEPSLDKNFLQLDNVTLLPHLGSATLETRIAMGEKVINNLDAFFNGEKLPNQVC